MQAVICPLCSSTESRISFSTVYKDSLFLVRQCDQCSLAWTVSTNSENIIQIYDNEQYYGRGDNKFISILQCVRSSLSRVRARRYLHMVPHEIKKPKVLEIGCAEGRLLRSFLELGCDCYGIEHVSYPEKRFISSDRIRYYLGNLTNTVLEDSLFDIIILWHVLEHMDNPDDVLNRVRELLAPEGIVVLAVPNFASMETSVFKQAWFHLDIPWHKYHFTKKSLQFLAYKNRFIIINNPTFCMEQGPYGIIQSILNALRFPRNELYEALKGSIKPGRVFSLIIQSLIGMSILIPCTVLSFMTSTRGDGSVLKSVLVKDMKTSRNF